MPKGLAYTGYILALIGGIILIITGALGFLGVAFIIIATGLERLGTMGRDVFTIILGILAIVGARYTDTLGWSIGLIIIGLVASGLGGVLVLVGGILGLVYRLSKGPRR
jgi:hypothetical protein